MDGYNNSVMIALLPTTSDWCSLELPHMTLVYAGEIKDLPTYAFNELAKDASYLSTLAMRSFVEKWNRSKHPFNPHATIGPVGMLPSTIPSSLYFNRLILSWGTDNLVFQLNS